MSIQRVAPSVLKPLREALTRIYWFKGDLKDFLVNAVPDRAITDLIDVNRSKREFSSDVVSVLFEQQHKYFDDLVNLILAVVDIKDPEWLKEVEDGELKYTDAVKALTILSKHVEPYRAIRTETEQIRIRAERQRRQSERRDAHSEALAELRRKFEGLRELNNQRRGYELEKFLPELFFLFDIDARGGFRTFGEQIDGSFSFDGTDFWLRQNGSPSSPPSATSRSSRRRSTADWTTPLVSSCP